MTDFRNWSIRLPGGSKQEPEVPPPEAQAVSSRAAPEHGLVEEVAALAGRVECLERTLQAMVAPAPSRPAGCLDRVWETAPLPARLAFAQGILAADHPYQGALQEAVALTDLCRKGPDLESWIAGYPALFADSVGRLRPPSPAEAETERVAVEALISARTLVDQHAAALGIEWVALETGDPIGEECEVLGEETSSTAAPGSVARLHRPGFRRGGRLVVPAQVYRAAPAIPTPDAQDPTPDAPPTPNAQRPAPNTQDPKPKTQSWLLPIQRAAVGDVSSETRVLTQRLEMLAAVGPETPDEALSALLEPLLALLGPGPRSPGLDPAWLEACFGARADLLGWLAEELRIEPICPAERSPVDPGQVQVTGGRRTAHAHEAGTVAKVERVGLRREVRVVIPARVLRYEMGEAA